MNPYIDKDGTDVDQAFSDCQELCCIFTRVSAFEEALKREEMKEFGASTQYFMTYAALMSRIHRAIEGIDGDVSSHCANALEQFREVVKEGNCTPALDHRRRVSDARRSILLPAHALTQDVLKSRHPAWTGKVGAA